MSQNCTSALDCSLDGIARECYGSDFSDERNFCDCSSFFGWTGENCDETSTVLIYERAFIIIFSILLLFHLLFTLIAVLPRIVANMSKTKALKTHFVLVILFILTDLFMLTSLILQIPGTFFPNNTEIVDFNFPQKEVVLPNFYLFVGKTLTTAITVLLLAYLVIVLTWFDVIKRVSKTFPEFLSKREIQLSRIVKFVIPVVLVVARILVFLDEFRIGPAVNILVVLFTIYPYTRLVYDLVKPIRSHGSSSQQEAATLVLFFHRALVVLQLLGIAVYILLAVELTRFDVQKYEAGAFIPLIFIKHIYYCCLFTALLFLTWYVNIVTNKLTKEKASRKQLLTKSSTMKHTN